MLTHFHIVSGTNLVRFVTALIFIRRILHKRILFKITFVYTGLIVFALFHFVAWEFNSSAKTYF